MWLKSDAEGKISQSNDDDLNEVQVNIANLDAQLAQTSIDALADVEITNGVAVGEILIWQGSYWVNTTPVVSADVDAAINSALDTYTANFVAALQDHIDNTGPEII